MIQQSWFIPVKKEKVFNETVGSASLEYCVLFLTFTMTTLPESRVSSTIKTLQNLAFQDTTVIHSLLVGFMYIGYYYTVPEGRDALCGITVITWSFDHTEAV